MASVIPLPLSTTVATTWVAFVNLLMPDTTSSVALSSFAPLLSPFPSGPSKPKARSYQVSSAPVMRSRPVNASTTALILLTIGVKSKTMLVITLKTSHTFPHSNGGALPSASSNFSPFNLTPRLYRSKLCSSSLSILSII